MNRKTKVGLSTLVILIVLFIPVIPVTYRELEPYQITKKEPYEVTEKEPYQVIETKTLELFSIEDYTLEPGHYIYQAVYIPSGRDIEYSVKASDIVDVFVFTSSEFEKYEKGRLDLPVRWQKF